MNLSALKLPCAVLFGVAVGWGIRGLPWWSGGVDVGNGLLSSAVAQGGSSVAEGSGSAGETGAGNVGGKPSQERLEMLAAKFRISRQEGDKSLSAMSLIMDTAEVSGNEMEPLMTMLSERGLDYRYGKSLMFRWAMMDPRAALAFALGRKELAGDEKVMCAIVQELAKMDPPAAKAALNQMEGIVRIEAGRVIVRLLQAGDPRGALAFAREIGDQDAESEALAFMAGSDPLGASAELVPGREEHRKAVESIAGALLTRGRTQFEEWVRSLNDPGHRAAARCFALERDAVNDPSLAAAGLTRWLGEEPEASELAGRISELITRNWVEKRKAPPATVGGWAVRLPEGDARESAVTETARAWLEQDVMAASAWLASVPQDEGRDVAVMLLVQKICSEAPAEAFEWARNMGNSHLRNPALRESMAKWAEQDTAAAEKALETLPAKDRMHLRDLVEAAKEEREKAQEQK